MKCIYAEAKRMVIIDVNGERFHDHVLGLSPCWVVGSFHTSRVRSSFRHGSVRHPIATSFRCVSLQLPFSSSHPKASLVTSFFTNPLRYHRLVAPVDDTVATNKVRLPNARWSVASYLQNPPCRCGNRTEKTRVSGHLQSLISEYTSVLV